MDLPILFSRIASTYDGLNHLFSFNQDRRWRRILASCQELPTGLRILDLCTGTADLAIELAKRHPSAHITGLDISPGMLEIGRRKILRMDLQGKVALENGDATTLPFDDASFDLVTIAFGLRNLLEKEAVLHEIFRVLNPDGRLRILEFTPPRNSFFGTIFRWYLKTVIPKVGGWVSGSRDAYRYLFTSIVSFLKPEEVIDLLREADFTGVRVRALTGGIVYLYESKKIPDRGYSSDRIG